MEEITILFAITVFMAGIFAMAGLRLWFITHQDVNMSKKVNGLCIDVGKIKKQLRDGYAGVVTQNPGTIESPMSLEDVTLEQFVETMGFDAKELNNPIVRPIAEKIFNQMKFKMVKGGDSENNPQML